MHKDRLGSVTALSDVDGNLREALAYDPWGKRRNRADSGTPDALDGKTDNRGFTGHEMLDALDLVHMNGRVYDPLVARFVSADPFIQNPTNGQGYNRYSYVLNNPTNLTDPTGFFEKGDSLRTIAQIEYNAFEKQMEKLGDQFKAATGAAKEAIGQKITNLVGSLGNNAKSPSANSDSGAGVPDAGRSGTSANNTKLSEIMNSPGARASAARAEARSNYWKAFFGGEYSVMDSDGLAGHEHGEKAGLVADAASVATGTASVVVKGIRLVEGLAAAKNELTVYRAFCGDARAQGFSWTTEDPRTVLNFRDLAGLPSGGASGATNTAEFLIQGRVNQADIIKARSALPLDGNRGGLPELIIDPKNVKIIDFSVLKR
jgi:RHS repeat-associated protein